MSRTMYKNQYNKSHYERINFVIPMGQKGKIKEVCAHMGVSVNEYLFRLVCEDLGTGESRMAKSGQGFGEEHQRLLEKWQVPKKYYEMIEGVQVEEINGMNKHYTIILKEGHINDLTGSRFINCDKTAELRRIITHTHKK